MKRAPEGRQLAVLGYAIKRWQNLTHRMKAPKRPHIGWLLANIGEAVDYMDRQLASQSRDSRGEELTLSEL